VGKERVAEAKSILIVEDHESLRTLIRQFLEEEGFVVKEAGNADTAISLLSDEKVDLVILDMVMYGKSGMDVMRYIYLHEMSVPVVVLTGAPTLATATEAVRLGATGYLIKPVNLERLLTIINSSLQAREENREANEG